MPPKTIGIIVMILIVILGVGYLLIKPQTQQPTQTPQVFEQSPRTDSTISASQAEGVLAGNTSKLYDFNKAK